VLYGDTPVAFKEFRLPSAKELNSEEELRRILKEFRHEALLMM
jgi:hypothetical protein